MPRPALPPLYFTDALGVAHRVHDVRFGPPHHAPHRRSAQPPGDGEANYRAFVTASGDVWLYRFAPASTYTPAGPCSGQSVFV